MKKKEKRGNVTTNSLLALAKKKNKKRLKNKQKSWKYWTPLEKEEGGVDREDENFSTHQATAVLSMVFFLLVF